MDNDLDILAQKYLDGNLTAEESDFVESLTDDQEWNITLEHHRSLRHELKKMQFLAHQQAHLKSIKLEESKNNKSYRWLIYSGIAAIILVLVYISLPKEDEQDSLAVKDDRTEQKATSAKDEGEGSEDSATNHEEASDQAAYDFKDEDIINDESVYNFKPKNAAYDSLLARVDSANTGVMTMISRKGSKDSTYVFSQDFNHREIEKSVSYVGSTGLYAIFNVISKDERTGEVQRSIMLFDRQMNYKARYVVKSVDELARAVTDRGFVVDIYHEDGKVTKVSYELPKELECLEFPLWYTVCPAYF